MAEQKITHTLIIKGSPAELYQIWADFERHPEFSENLKEVKILDEKTSHWVMEGPLGKDIEWTAKMTRDEAGKRIAWQTLEGDVKNSGQITFEDLSNNETQVTVTMIYIPPAGKLGEIGAKVLADPAERVEKDLYAFKKYVEQNTGRAFKMGNK
jgi:uncharacterized membrane protein